MRQIRNLKFLGHPMFGGDGVFWFHSPKTDIRVCVDAGSSKRLAHFRVTFRGWLIHTAAASGTIAARNKSERWFRKWAADVGEIALGKGGGK